MAELLVTGAAGFIGSNFVHYWLGRYAQDRVVVLDALTYAGHPGSLESAIAAGRCRLVRGDICDGPLVESLLREHSVATVVHFAAESHVDRSISGPDEFIRTNIVGTHALLGACRKVWLQEGKAPQHRFHHVSTDEVYGSLGPTDPAFTETTAYAPNSPYSASKAGSDHLVRAYHHTYGLSVTTSNCSNNYGPFHFPEKLIPLAIINLLHGRPVPVYGDGRNVRDWLYVEDHCRAIDLVLAHGRPGEVYNVGGNSESENIVLVQQLCAVVDQLFATDSRLGARFPQCPAASGKSCGSLITFVKDRPGHDRRYAVDPSRIRNELGFVPSVTLADGLKRTVEWFCANQSWWSGVMDGSYRKWIAEHYG